MFNLQQRNKSEQLKRIEGNSRRIIDFLSSECGERTIRNYAGLNRAREFIKAGFYKNGYVPGEHVYRTGGREVANIIAEREGLTYPESIILVGAHYDTVEDSPGADDNASAIAALLEIARLMSGIAFDVTVRFVAFTLEEPPFFSTHDMGSKRYAEQCRKRGEDIILMISLDMLGFAGNKVRQDIPAGVINRDRWTQGDFLAVVSLPSMSVHVSKWKDVYNKKNRQKIVDIVAPASVKGMHLSDHYSFIQTGYPAILLTDTAFYRNRNYHQPGDTPDTINYSFLTENIRAISGTLCEYVGGPSA